MAPADLPLPWLDALRGGLLVGDGAMGTQLHAEGVPFSACYEGLNVTQPERIQRIHASYVQAGARVIETNTFGANRPRLSHHGLGERVREINAAAVRVAREAAREAGAPVYVLGTLGPSGLDRPEDTSARYDAFREQAAALVEAGVEALLIETMIRGAEAETALAAARSVAGAVPVAVMLTPGVYGALSDGVEVSTAARRLRDLGAAALGLNCVDPATALASLPDLARAGLPLLVSPSAGLPHKSDGKLSYDVTDDEFLAAARRACALGVRLVGGCCGTTPATIARLCASLAAEPIAGHG